MAERWANGEAANGGEVGRRRGDVGDCTWLLANGERQQRCGRQLVERRTVNNERVSATRLLASDERETNFVGGRLWRQLQSSDGVQVGTASSGGGSP
ncbi:host cell division inhibitor Icd-like protein [Sesbania bispinosa]|nr:host cell division inhibitor Icd-like protein [Sesbania bispinosa]